MPTFITDNIGVIVVAMITAVPGIVAIWRQSHKDRADATDTITKAAERAIRVCNEQYDAQLADIQAQMARTRAEHQREMLKMETEISELRDAYNRLVADFEALLLGAHRLRDQVVGGGMEPVYHPPERRRTDGK